MNRRYGGASLLLGELSSETPSDGPRALRELLPGSNPFVLLMPIVEPCHRSRWQT